MTVLMKLKSASTVELCAASEDRGQSQVRRLALLLADRDVRAALWRQRRPQRPLAPLRTPPRVAGGSADAIARLPQACVKREHLPPTGRKPNGD